MYRTAEQRLTRFVNIGQQALLKGSRIGIEKESLRVTRNGYIAQTPHPSVLGSALTHPYITTDYSEASLEFITPPFADLGESLRFLGDIHQFVYERLDEELLWGTSMPCVVEGEASIPIAYYGTSKAGTVKHVYRRGLGYRYGRMMQVIAGVHFNFSLPDTFWSVFQDHEQDASSLQDFVSNSYFCLIRNLQRFGWLILYLFGASPAVDKSFLGGQIANLAEFDANTCFGPYATSLRMSDIGYQNKKKAKLNISYDSLDAYVASLTWAVETPHPEYERIGIVVDGEYRQLNASILQIEGEYYSSIRPKQVILSGERLTLALKRRGVQYVELRSLDVNAFDPVGVNGAQLRFLEAFLVFCLFHDSPWISAAESKAIDHNLIVTAYRGRDPALLLQRNARTQPLREWAIEICDALEGFCEVLDEGKTDRPYSKALEIQRETIRDADRALSARILAEMQQAKEGFLHFAMRMSQKHQMHFKALPMVEDRMRYFTEEAKASLRRQREMEVVDDIDRYRRALAEMYARAYTEIQCD